jgi:hypothetical protein
MLGLVTVKVLWAQSATGAATVVRLIDNAEIRTAAQRIAERLQLSGFHGLDFILEHDTGNAYLLELNPRCTQLGHLPIGGQGDLAGMLCEAFTGVHSQTNQTPISGDTIAFFPQAALVNQESGSKQTGYQDIPWQEPRLVRELMRTSWPERQLLARVYHAVRPPKLEPAMPFEAPAQVADTNK